MWKTESLYKLRSELIRLSVFVDGLDSAVDRSHQAILQSLVDDMQAKERSENLFYSRIGASVEAAEPDVVFSVRHPHSPTLPRQPDRRPRTSDRRAVSLGRPVANTPPPGWQDTIWTNTELFLSPVYDVSQFKSLLAPSKVASFDRQILDEPFGPHYSQTLPRRSELILPPSVFEEPRSQSSAAHLHNRLVCAFVEVPLGDPGVPRPYDDDVMPDLQNGEELLAQLTAGASATVRTIIARGTPAPEGLGISRYGQLAFDQRLLIELEALGITAEKWTLSDSNCPVMRSMAFQIKHQGVVADRANQMKRMIADMIREKRRMFEERVQVKARWDDALARYLSSRAPEPKVAKKKRVLVKHSDAE
jgi:hypothetical protein